MNNCVEFFLPWVLRAAEPLAEIDGHPERPWSLWADFMEFGVDNFWAASLVADGMITDRTLAREIGQRLETSVPDGEPTIEQVRHVLTKTMESDSQRIGQLLNWFRQRGTSL